MTTLKFAEGLRDLVSDVDVLLSDIWGVVHNGLVAFPDACAALRNFRDQGGTVILITNAPRPAEFCTAAAAQARGRRRHI